jgi:hypothetical protein
MKWLMSIAVLLTALGLAFRYVFFFRQAQSGERWGPLTSLTLLIAGNLIILIDQYLKAKREEKIGLVSVQLLMAVFLATVSTFLGYLK